MAGDRDVRQSSSWRARAGAVGVAVATGIAFGPVLSTVAAPVAVQAEMMQTAYEGCDTITSGGFVVAPSTGRKANFGVHGGCKNGEFWGHLNFVDHANGYHVQSVAITGYVVNAGGDPNARDVCGVAQTNNDTDVDPVFFVARLVDNGEPGGADKFGLKMSNSYTVPLLNLGTAKPGGNVQLHKPNASTTAWPATTFGQCPLPWDGGNPE